MVPPINNSNYLIQSSNNGGGIYSNHVTPNNMIHGSNGGITNQAYSRDARYFTNAKMQTKSSLMNITDRDLNITVTSNQKTDHLGPKMYNHGRNYRVWQ